MTENEITGDILDAAIKIHRKFGPGMLESVYERLLEAELLKRGHSVERQKSVSFEYEGMTLEDAFRVDLLVDERIVVELKAVDAPAAVCGRCAEGNHGRALMPGAKPSLKGER